MAHTFICSLAHGKFEISNFHRWKHSERVMMLEFGSQNIFLYETVCNLEHQWAMRTLQRNPLKIILVWRRSTKASYCILFAFTLPLSTTCKSQTLYIMYMCPQTMISTFHVYINYFLLIFNKIVWGLTHLSIYSFIDIFKEDSLISDPALFSIRALYVHKYKYNKILKITNCTRLQNK